MIETLKDVKTIGGYSVVVMDELRTSNPEMFRPDGSMHYHLFEKEIRPFNFIYVRHDTNSISFTLQNGPIKESKVNGCQVDTLICAAETILRGLNSGTYECEENRIAIEKLNEALMWLSRRRKNREKRGVEGTSKP